MVRRTNSDADPATPRPQPTPPVSLTPTPTPAPTQQKPNSPNPVTSAAAALGRWLKWCVTDHPRPPPTHTPATHPPTHSPSAPAQPEIDPPTLTAPMENPNHTFRRLCNVCGGSDPEHGGLRTREVGPCPSATPFVCLPVPGVCAARRPESFTRTHTTPLLPRTLCTR